MRTLVGVGGIRLFGNLKISDDMTFSIHGIKAEFDSDVSVPDIEPSSEGDYFQLPCHRGQKDYEIHALETGDILILKGEEISLCTLVEGKPKVLVFRPVPGHTADARKKIARK